MRYSEVNFTCKGGEEWHRDVLKDSLASIGFDTFEDQPQGFCGYIASQQLNEASLQSVLMQQPLGFEVIYDIKEIEPQNWNELWEKSFQPIAIGDACYVRASFNLPAEGYTYEIVIDPKMAFGTGHHQTTSLMLRYLLDTQVEGQDILDMGCGTGILAILAAKKGAKKVVAIDYDPVCCESTRDNALINQTPHIEVREGEADHLESEVFDLILANINRNILLEQMPAYARALRQDGLLFLSGFYEGKDLEMLQEKAHSVGFTYLDHVSQDRWVAARFVKS
jgi:ribosomal protein L11 methyltransferase